MSDDSRTSGLELTKADKHGCSDNQEYKRTFAIALFTSLHLQYVINFFNSIKMAEQIHFIAHMFPDPQKVDRLIELIKEVAAYVHDNEPAAWQYEFYKSTTSENEPVVIVIERYFDQAAINAHVHNDGYQKFSKAIENEKLCVRDHTAYFLSQIAGFKRS